MTVKIHGHPQSTCTRRVICVCKEKNVPYEVIAVDWAKMEHKSPEWIAKQPFGQMPWIEDDGLVIYESRAICKYIALKYRGQGTELLPPSGDLKAVALFEQAASVEAFNFDPAVSEIVAEKVFKPMRGAQTDDARVEVLKETIKAKLQGYEKILSKQKYVAGDTLTLVDLFHLPYGSMLENTGVKIDQEIPNVARWWKDISSREAWKST
ncbi:hypothetical protein HGRIS_010558 [Hohenbuehelia grisea]|uniref:glutathione transferase n=1 Tax=Hohenbuehelia grisea TaxID=104357 RepID=A0ABR3IXF3_9AGAR